MTFKEWVEQHNPGINWNWDSPEEIHRQLCSVIAECGSIDIDTIFQIMEHFYESGLTAEQENKFMKKILAKNV